MKTTCCHCGQTDDRDLIHFARDEEGNWWHKDCRHTYLEIIAAQLERAEKARRGRPDPPNGKKP